MLYYLFYPFRDVFFGFNVFRYITFRAAFAALTAMVLTIMLGPFVIKKLSALKYGQELRNEGPHPLSELHTKKQGTPTMGGILIIFAIFISIVLWADIFNKFILLSVLTLLYLGALGFWDDYTKIKKKQSQGLTAKQKLFFQILLAISIAAVLYFDPVMGDVFRKLTLPFFKNISINLGLFYFVFIILVFVGSSNAVNITDGQDGLAIGCTTIAALAFAIMSYIIGNANFASYLHVLYIPNAGELAVVCASMVGAGLGFLWYNAYPAQLFMGDTGSLTLGGIIGLVAILIKKELMIFMVGGVFVVEIISVIIQVLYFKSTGKRFFLMAPLHHHFEVKGIPESKITIRFWILAIIFALLSLSALKLR